MTRTTIRTAAVSTFFSLIAGVGLAVTQSADATNGTTTLKPVADAYVDAAFPNRKTGGSDKLVAADAAPGPKTTYLRFAVPTAPAGARLASAKLVLFFDRTASGNPELHAVTGDWAESTVRASTAPAVGGLVSSGWVTATGVVFDATAAVSPGATFNFAVTNPTGVSAFSSREARTNAPQLLLEWVPVATTTTTAAPPTTAPPSTTTTAPPTTTTAPPPTTSTTTPPPSTTTTTVPPTSPATTSVRIGMSAPRDQWEARLSETGQVYARRLFGQLSSPAGMVSLANDELRAGRMPILSFKVPNNDWTGAANGTYDAMFRDLAARLDALPGRVFVAIHHEPEGDGTPAAYVAMQRHVLPILAPADNVDAGVIVNGFWWSAGRQGYTDAEIAQWLPADLLRLAEVVGADTYHGGTATNPGEDAGVKIRRLSEWATRVGVQRLGIGEYNGLTAAAITAAGDAILADPRYVFAAAFNSSENNREGVNWQLSGDRLTAFQNTLSQARRMSAS